MRFIRLDPEKAYRGSMLWLPKKYVPMEVLEAALTYWFTVREGDEYKPVKVEAWREERHHVVVPREFPREEIPCDVVDLQPPTQVVAFKPDIAPRDDIQAEAMEAMKTNRCGILNLGCGRGKTVIGLQRIADGGGPALVVVGDDGLLNQWRKEARDRLRLPNDSIGVVQGKKAEWDQPLVLATVQTLWRRIESDSIQETVRRRFQTVLFDEAHHMSAPKFNPVASFFTGDRFGLTATAERTDGNERFYLYHLGPIIYANHEVDVPPTCYFGHTGITPTAEERNRFFVNDMVNIQRIREWQAKNAVRNARIARLAQNAAASGNKVIVLSHNKKDHIKRLKALLPEAGEVTGDVRGQARLDNLQDNAIVVGTIKASAEGLDSPELNVGIWCTTFPNEIEFQQGTGRLARGAEGKDKAEAIFVVDNLPKCRDHARALERHAKKRGYKVEHFKLED